MAITFRSREVDIHAYARDMVEELNQVEGKTRDCLYGWIDRQLELTIWTAKGGKWKAEVLLTFGGPTVTIEIDSRYTFGTLFHSWGECRHTGSTKTSIEFEHTGLKDALEELARASYGGLE
tara:strand:- start:229 stop:591 length:363 start_codon:yes stop_codon:yes gene_type:complete